MRTPVSDAQVGFHGGLNTVADPSQVQPNELRTAVNGRLTTFGALQKRRGTERIHSVSIGSGNPVRGGFAWKRAASVQELALSNGLLWTATYAMGTTFTSQAGAFDAAAYPCYAPFRDGTVEVCYIADGGPLNKWDGTNVTVNLAGTPSVARIALQNQRLFGISGLDQTLYYSALNNGDTLATGAVDTGSAVIRTYSNQELKALLALGDSLILFHREGISRFTGYTSDDISLATGTRGVSSDVGTIAPDSVVAVENTGYFLSDRGIYRITEAGVVPISIKIENVINNLDQTKFNRVKAVHNRAYREIWFYFPDVGCYVYNYRLDAWTGPMVGIFESTTTTQSLWSTLDATGKPIVLMGGADGFVRLLDTPTFNQDDVSSTGGGGNTIHMTAQLRRMYFGAPEEEKMFRKLQVQANLSSLNTGYSVIYSSSTGAQSVSVPPNTRPVQEIQLSGRGTYLDITVADDDPSPTAPSETSRVTADGVSYGRRYSTV